MSARTTVICSIVAGLTIACGRTTPDTGSETGSAAATPTTVPTIVSVTCTLQKSPSQLTIVANGEVPTAAWTGATLRRRVYVTAPVDSIWEYDFVATPPSGMAAQMITPITAQDTWADFPAQSVVGVRVYGEGTGTKTVRLSECTTQ